MPTAKYSLERNSRMWMESPLLYMHSTNLAQNGHITTCYSL